MIIRAFPAIRPTPEHAALVAALPYDVMSREEARKMAWGNPYSFLHVDRAEIDLKDYISPYDEIVYQHARAVLAEMRETGVFIQDDASCLYLYRLTREGRAQTGLVACVSIDDYLAGRIKKHEMTREEKEQDRIRHVDVCDAHTGPVFLTYRSQKSIRDLVETWIQTPTLYAFTAEDGVIHEVWRIDDESALRQLEKAFTQVDSFYIADGHHRMSAAAQVGLQRRRTNPDYCGNEGFNFSLAVIFPDDQMTIMAYNRLVRDLNGLTVESFLNRIREVAVVDAVSAREDLMNIAVLANKSDPVTHTEIAAPRCFGMYLKGRWYLLCMQEGVDSGDPVEALDVSLLQGRILRPILGIEDPRRDQRIDFVGGIRGLGELENRVDSGDMAVAFALYPASVEEFFRVSDAGKMMPPKSTWFEPKLRSGLFIHGLE